MATSEFTSVLLPRVPRSQQHPSCAEESIVRRILSADLNDDGVETYQVVFEDTHVERLTYEQITALEDGSEALEIYQEQATEKDESYENADDDRGIEESQTSEEDESTDDGQPRHALVRRRGRPPGRRNRPSTRHAGSSTWRTRPCRQLRSTNGGRDTTRLLQLDTDEDIDDDSSDFPDLDVFKSDIAPSRKRKRTLRDSGRRRDRRPSPTRQSARSTRTRVNMKEANVGDIYRSDSSQDDRPAVPKAIGAREVFQEVSRSDPFRRRHIQQCETCGDHGSGPRGQLIYCQGCCLAYHTGCIGQRSTRDHLVTKVDEREFVLQCRRCISHTRKKEPTAPDQGICQSCRRPGHACRPFRARKTPAQEERDREEHDGVDPICKVDASRLNQADHVLFRCVTCWRAWHFHHLRSRIDIADTGADDELVADARFREFSPTWQCLDCDSMERERTKIGELVAWRPVDVEEYEPSDTAADVDEDAMEYLVKWEKRSYFQVVWMPGAWVWGVTTAAMRRAFVKRHDGHNMPTMTTQDAIPEDYLRIDIVLDVKFTSIVTTRAEEVDKARVREVDTALIKYQGLGYEESVWEKVPTPEDGDRWKDFVRAYETWAMGRYVRQPSAGPLQVRIEQARDKDFLELEKKRQPDILANEGKELMKYQLDGVNWLYYRWYQKANAILADEMGLGKTIQIIGMMAALVESHHCFPFLVVVPNSTCPNWRREIQEWAPSLRAVAYYGTAASRKMSYDYELYPEGAKELRAHIVITSYEAAADEGSRRFFKSVAWQGLIVDEGQRLKSDVTQLYGALTSLKVGFRILLTGTPLQNHARELFHLLHFLDDSFDAAALELEYAELTRHNVPQLHSMIRPFFLRRTKAQVLTFLPPMAQIILPVSMTSVQRKLYMSILAKSPELVRSIFGRQRRMKSNDRANLNNILMHLRQCLCHPFVYSQDIEERSADVAVSHRNLVDASAKLQLLEILLPKLQQRGHRVLIFSQFLNMLDIVEDFLDGLSLEYTRLDGSIGTLVKQKRIDAFNAPNSTLFAFLLSTRAGGVGINLATADTVIIMDPDFNPHQDMQALSRAHRIGQKNHVLCFQLMTRSSAEEKIVQIGRKKMALDHVLIERMDADDDDGVDVESVLRHGVADLMDDAIPDLPYDEHSVEKLLDRRQGEDTKAAEDKSAEAQFPFARVWAADTASLADSLPSDDESEQVPDRNRWDRILQERERQAAEDAARRPVVLGRGKRNRTMVDYGADAAGQEQEGEWESDASDTDFPVKASDGEAEAEDDEANAAADGALAEDVGEIWAPPPRPVGGAASRVPASTDRPHASGTGAGTPSRSAASEAPRPVSVPATRPAMAPPSALVAPASVAPVQAFRRAHIVWPSAAEQRAQAGQNAARCIACGTWHATGSCPLKLAGAEHCSLCGLAHYGVARTCPHLRLETQVRAMLEALKHSTEPHEHVELARKYLKGVKGTLIQKKKIQAHKAEEEEEAAWQREQARLAPGGSAPPAGAAAALGSLAAGSFGAGSLHVGLLGAGSSGPGYMYSSAPPPPPPPQHMAGVASQGLGGNGLYGTALAAAPPWPTRPTASSPASRRAGVGGHSGRGRMGMGMGCGGGEGRRGGRAGKRRSHG